MTRSVVILMLLVVISLVACNNTAAFLPTPTMEGVGKKVSVTAGRVRSGRNPAAIAPAADLSRRNETGQRQRRCPNDLTAG
jgi:predicted small secreted protein